MPEKASTAAPPFRERCSALSRWDNEGGAVSDSSPEAYVSGKDLGEVPELSNSELVQLRIRVIALENVIITLLAGASNEQLDLVREMATAISPRADSTQHPLTIHAATQVNRLAERAVHFRVEPTL